MKFDNLVEFQKGISYTSLAIVIIFGAFIYYAVNKINDKPIVNDENPIQKIEQQKKINERANQVTETQLPLPNKDIQNSKPQTIVKNEVEPKKESRKTSSRELGFDIYFGADQPRIIKTFVLPEVKKAGSGRVILKYRFSIRPDGSVAKVFPIMKGEPELELEAMNLLRKWRFEKLPTTADQIDQKVEISFRPQ